MTTKMLRKFHIKMENVCGSKGACGIRVQGPTITPWRASPCNNTTPILTTGFFAFLFLLPLFSYGQETATSASTRPARNESAELERPLLNGDRTFQLL
jgi:hypothetical protein